jgi:hypothetical protein
MAAAGGRGDGYDAFAVVVDEGEWMSGRPMRDLNPCFCMPCQAEWGNNSQASSIPLQHTKVVMYDVDPIHLSGM